MRPPPPVPTIDAAFRPCSRSRRRTAGVMRASELGSSSTVRSSEPAGPWATGPYVAAGAGEVGAGEVGAEEATVGGAGAGVGSGSFTSAGAAAAATVGAGLELAAVAPDAWAGAAVPAPE